MKTRKQIIEEYAEKGYSIGKFKDIENYVNYVGENTLIFLNKQKNNFSLVEVCPRYEGDNEDVDYEKYKKYIRTKKWKTLASLVKEKAGNKCIFCKSEKKLVAHHHNYINLYNETEDDLICICNTCHYKIHRGCDCSIKETQCACCEYSKNNYKILYEFLSSQR